MAISGADVDHFRGFGGVAVVAHPAVATVRALDALQEIAESVKEQFRFLSHEYLQRSQNVRR